MADDEATDLDSDQSNVTSLIDGEKLEDAIGLCLSGGGYRALLFHAGAIFRLNELGLLNKLDRVSSVSGGSMAAAALAVAYGKFSFDPNGRVTNLRETFLEPVLSQADDSIDIASGFAGLNPFTSAAEEAARSYDRNLTHGSTLSQLPVKPRFVFNATNLMTGSAFRFQRAYIADYKIGQFTGLDLRLADVVAASAAFPPFLSPAIVNLSPGTIEAHTKGKMATAPYTEKAILTDGGVYDNLGTETVWRRCRTVLVSDAGHPFSFEDEPKQNWLQQSLRVLDIAMDQSQNLRERILSHAYKTGARQGAMWQLSTGVDDKSQRPPLLTETEFDEARSISTRLWRMPKRTQTLLLKAGYAHAASRLRTYFGPAAGGPPDAPDGDPPEA
ncbi:NTE family protein [Sinorhizobium kostiense]|uniref:NTE family protein n=1 Tax=Sinorhizobium kostiense TaxID=76747 RepID=A0ABS4R092_9HYPH|nr:MULTISPECIES: patatin-like phospholipase family protein [Sinorhizobium]MBP2236303.1 NTE family protein [Sinorhizobium kostiense]PST20701.1 patatin-like phospholipase family protein [Mesorhizobium plurifarium]